MELVIVLLVALLIIFAISYFFRRKIYNEIDRLEGAKIQILNRSITEEMQKIKHLNMTGQTEEFFERWRKEWDEIVTSHMPKVEELLYEAEEYADKYRFKKSNQVLAHIDDLLIAAESNIEDILREINDLVSSEQKNRSEIENAKETYKKARKNLLAYSHLYGDLYSKLESDLQGINEGFAQFDNETENGNYMAAREILQAEVKELERLQANMDVIPKLLAEVKQTLPNQLNSLMDGFKEMTDQGYNLEHLQVDREIEALQKELGRAEQVLIHDVKLDEAEELLQVINEAVQSLYDHLELEVDNGREILTKMPELTDAFEQLKKDKIQTTEETELVKESYQLSRDEMLKADAFDQRMEQLSKQFEVLKNKFDHKHVAFSLLKEEIGDLENQMNEAKREHDEYRKMLQDLRKEELQARESILHLKHSISETSRKLKTSNVPGVPESLKTLLEKASIRVKEVHEKLNGLPLNMAAVNESLLEAEQLVFQVKEQTDELVERVFFIERIIQYGNRFRSSNEILSEQLNEAERKFHSFDYESAYDIAVTAVEKVSPGSTRRIEYYEKEQLSQ
ncbi:MULTISPECIES: septation ring formation regulator EzrA [Bacillus]|uniref:Septation ring formation regulator EzrA n=2 Tax=Bacillus TaxID=1386 RepID=A0A0M4FK54_9BACI|nr:MULTISPECIES: septation ring formation regulator EzrA [Bacillus]ALC82029.1 septation ring formation regulator EzrA [Bacillus gobiensis]MBP1083372.1 septation ring formation regulator [Bacillus capparidis]MED1097804.1 septation ring formation regulator EzrA [Bacillus capparidis]